MQQTTSIKSANAGVPPEAEQPAASHRPVMDAFEVRYPRVGAGVLRVLLRMPPALRRRVFTSAFARAEAAFNRGDFEAVTALWADDVVYVPPPALHAGPPIIGHSNVLAFWNEVSRRYDRSRIANLSIEALDRKSFVRTARLSHQGPGETLEYVIRQTTYVDRGRVIRQVNVEV
jgi:SnoaL-like domain